MGYTKSKQSVRKASYTRVQHNWNPYGTDNYNETQTDTQVTEGFTGTYGESGAIDWKKRIASVLQAGTEMYIVSESNAPFSLRCEGSFTSFVNHYHGTLEGTSLAANLSPAVASVSFDKANTTALTRLVTNARAARTPVQGGVIAGEFGKTLALIRNPMKTFRLRLTRYSRDAKKRLSRAGPRKGRKRRRLAILSDTWLEYNFGWRQLVRDIDDISEELANISVGVERTPHKVVSGFGEDHAVASQNAPVYLTGYGFQIGRKAVRTLTTKVIYKAAVRTDENPAWSHVRLGVSLDNFLPTVWELIPYSFLVDYFTNVGNIIEAFALRSSYIGWTMRWVITEDLKSDRPYRVLGSFSGGPRLYRRRTIDRQPYTGSLIPPLEFRVPGFGTQWLNIAALSRLR